MMYLFSLVIFVLLALLGALVWLARPWLLPDGSWMNRLRVGVAVETYDFWLSLHGASWRRRRDLREELRANLWEAAGKVGGKHAVRSVGSLRRLATDGIVVRRRPQWGLGVGAALVVLELILAVQFFVAVVWRDAAVAAQVTRLEGSVSALPGSRLLYQEFPGGGFSLEFTQFGPLPVIAMVVTFLAVSAPWRLRRPTP